VKKYEENNIKMNRAASAIYQQNHSEMQGIATTFYLINYPGHFRVPYTSVIIQEFELIYYLRVKMYVKFIISLKVTTLLYYSLFLNFHKHLFLFVVNYYYF
jgi:hypothetical protein